jgi:hypothetical protein
MWDATLALHRCVRTRTVIAICLDRDDDASWYNGSSGPLNVKGYQVVPSGWVAMIVSTMWSIRFSQTRMSANLLLKWTST